MNIVKKTCLEQQMTKKIAVEVDAKICFGKKLKNQHKLVKKKFWMYFITASKKVWPNLKQYSKRILSEFNENGK